MVDRKWRANPNADALPFWQMPHGGGHRWLVERSNEKRLGLTPYQPFHEHRGLFQQFGHLQPTEEDALSFANQYGALWIGDVGRPPPGPLGVSSRTSGVFRLSGQKQLLQAGVLRREGRFGFGESFAYWRSQIRLMAEVLSFWNAILDDDFSSVRNRVRWNNADGLNYEGQETGQGHQAAASSIPPFVRERFDADGEAALMRYVLVWIVNKELQRHEFIAQLELGSVDRRPNAGFVPKSLIGTLWIQAALAIEGSKRYRKCLMCSRWFDLTDEKRGDAEVCGDACRQRKRRARLKACQLDSEGARVAEISKQVGVDRKTIEGWVKK